MIRGLIGAIAGLIILAGGGYAAAVAYVNRDGGRLAERYFQPWGPRGSVAVGGIRKSLLSNQLVITGVKVRTPEGRRFTIARIVVRNYDWINFRRPEHADVTMTGVAVTPNGLGPALAGPVKAAGVERLVANVRYRYRYNGDARRLTIERARVELVGIGTLTASARFEIDAVPALDRLHDRRELIAVAATGKLVGARARFRERALVKRIVAGYAAQQKLEPDEAAAELLDLLRRERRRARDPIARDALAAVIAFFRNPGEIEAVAAPKAPVSLLAASQAAMLDPARLKALLGLTFRATPPEAPGRKAETR